MSIHLTITQNAGIVGIAAAAASAAAAAAAAAVLSAVEPVPVVAPVSVVATAPVAEIAPMTIREALTTIFQNQRIRNRAELDNWCLGDGKRKLYFAVQRLAPTHCARLVAPDASIRATYETMLQGYAQYKN